MHQEAHSIQPVFSFYFFFRKYYVLKVIQYITFLCCVLCFMGHIPVHIGFFFVDEKCTPGFDTNTDNPKFPTTSNKKGNQRQQKIKEAAHVRTSKHKTAHQGQEQRDEAKSE